MNGVELYARFRYAVRIEGISGREAGRRFGIDPRTVVKMLSFSLPLDTGASGAGSICGDHRADPGRGQPAERRHRRRAAGSLRPRPDRPSSYRATTRIWQGLTTPVPQGPRPSHRRENRDPWECSIPPRCQKASAEAFWHSSLMHFYSDPRMHFCSGVDTDQAIRDPLYGQSVFAPG